METLPSQGGVDQHVQPTVADPSFVRPSVVGSSRYHDQRSFGVNRRSRGNLVNGGLWLVFAPLSPAGGGLAFMLARSFSGYFASRSRYS